MSLLVLGAATVLAFAGMGMLAAIWAVASPALGRIYTGIRIAESAGLWLFTGWGRYFTSVPAGQPFEFLSIFKSSVPFGVASSLVTAAIGWAAYRKVTQRHLDVVIAAPKGGFNARWIRETLQPVFPHVLPEAANTRPASSRPDPNPFTGLRDLRDGTAVDRVAEALPWQHAVTFALAIDSLAPLSDRAPIDELTRTVWRLARAGQLEPKPHDIARIRAAFTQCMTELPGRDLPALDRIHETVAASATTHDLAADLTAAARTKHVFPVTAVAWLRFVDPLLLERVVSADLD